jgi:K+-transporting ATPase KdpF subunit
MDARRCGFIRREFVAVVGAERRAHGRKIMSGSEIIGFVLSVGLFVYLTIALLKPEWFA